MLLEFRVRRGGLQKNSMKAFFKDGETVLCLNCRKSYMC